MESTSYHFKSTTLVHIKEHEAQILILKSFGHINWSNLVNQHFASIIDAYTSTAHGQTDDIDTFVHQVPRLFCYFQVPKCPGYFTISKCLSVQASFAVP